jgi:APA family basic amino acid/polyamine antiporter
VAIAIYATLAALVAASGSFREIAVMAVAGTLVLYLICCLGVLRLRAKNVAGDGPPFVAPGGMVVPLAAAAMILWLLSTLAWREIVTMLVFVTIAALIYGIRHLTRKPAEQSAARLADPRCRPPATTCGPGA